MVNIARAQSAIGGKVQEQANVEKALKIQPNLEKAIRWKDKIGLAKPISP